MRTICLFFGIFLFSLCVRAQVIDTAYMECWYKFSYIKLKLETMGEDLMVLQIGKIVQNSTVNIPMKATPSLLPLEG